MRQTLIIDDVHIKFSAKDFMKWLTLKKNAADFELNRGQEMQKINNNFFF